MAKRRTGEAGIDIPSVTMGVLELSAPQVAWSEGAGARAVVARHARRPADELERAADGGTGADWR